MSFSVFRLNDESSTACIIVGLGLIGSAVQRECAVHGKPVYLNGRFDWSESDTIVQALKPFIRDSDGYVEIFWCAGKSGFFASDEDLEQEFLIFEKTISELTKLGATLGVNMLSSAGGLYEGCDNIIESMDTIHPLRPYGRWKHLAEQSLQSMDVRSKIYRVSSVYGSSSSNSRRGILSALFDSVYLNSPATVYAKASTLRDYVDCADIAKYIVSRIPEDRDVIALLASGRPTSIDMLINMVGRATRRRPRVTYHCDTNNDLDIVFSSNLIASEFKPRPIEEGVLALASQYKNFTRNAA